MVAGAALVLNAVRHLCGIPEEMMLISEEVLATLQHLKTDILKREKSTLSLEEVLSALTISATVNPVAETAVEELARAFDAVS